MPDGWHNSSVQVIVAPLFTPVPSSILYNFFAREPSRIETRSAAINRKGLHILSDSPVHAHLLDQMQWMSVISMAVTAM